MVWNYGSSQHEVVKDGEKWEADRDGILYWAYDDSITKETDPNCAKWFSINGTRHPVAECKVPDVQVDGLSVFQFKTNYGSTSVAAVDSEGVSSPAVASGQAVPPATYVIKYDGNGADGGTAPTSQNKTQYTDITLATNSGGLTRIGYRFTGWNTAKDGTGTTYSAGATYSADEGVTLYAQWEAVDAVVLTPESGAVNHGATVTLTPPKSDATIYYQIGGTSEVVGTPGQTVTVTLYNASHSPSSTTGVAAGIPEGGEVTITAYAKYADDTQSEVTTGDYRLNQYTVRYEGNGNTSGDVPAEQTFYSGGSVTVPGEGSLTKTGYTFAGWQGDDGQPHSQGIDYDEDKNLTLTAKWEQNTYTVKFVGNGGVGSMDDQQFTYDTAKNLTKNTFTLTGYTFAGWEDDKGTVYTDEKEVSNLTAALNGTVTLTAQWTPNTYYVRFVGDGNTGGSMVDQQFTYDQSQKLKVNAFKRTGYTFAGWKDDTGAVYTDGKEVSNLTAVQNRTVTLTAQWKANTYTVTFVNDGASGGSSNVTATYDQPLPSVTVPTKTDYTFGGYFDGPDGTGKQYYDHKGRGVVPWTETSGITLYAKFSHEPNQDDDGTYEVANVGNLLWIGDQLQSGDLTSFNLKLTADIVIPSGEWVPINLPNGTPVTFDGQGHSITFDGTSDGLFVDFHYSTIENLVLKGNITGDSVGGALIKNAYCTVIRNVMSLVAVTNTGKGETGGLVGKFGGKDDYGPPTTIENCAVYADVSSDGGTAGGLIGVFWEGQQYGKILNSVYMGKVKGNKIGAVVGYNASNPNETSTLHNIYYCETTRIDFIGDRGGGGIDEANVVSKTEDEIASADAANLLGNQWEYKTGEKYPTLKKNP